MIIFMWFIHIYVVNGPQVTSLKNVNRFFISSPPCHLLMLYHLDPLMSWWEIFSGDDRLNIWEVCIWSWGCWNVSWFLWLWGWLVWLLAVSAQEGYWLTYCLISCLSAGHIQIPQIVCHIFSAHVCVECRSRSKSLLMPLGMNSFWLTTSTSPLLVFLILSFFPSSVS